MTSPQWRFPASVLTRPTPTSGERRQPCALTAQSLCGVLHYLVTHPDRLVRKDELLDAVWPELR